MALFKCTALELAKILADKPKVYQLGVDFFNLIDGKGVLEEKVESDLKKDMALFKEAFELASNSQWFGFHVYDSWAEEHEEQSEGIELYQKVDDTLVCKLGLDSDGVATEEHAVKMLTIKNVKKLYTLTPGKEGYFGVNYRVEDGDHDIIIRKHIQDYQLPYFRNSGIEVITVREIISI